MKKSLKISGLVILQLFTTFVSLLVMFFCYASIGHIIPSGNYKTSTDIEIFVRSNGVHTDLCLPAQSEQCNWNDFLDISHINSRSSIQYVAIGWGDKGFYLDTPSWDDLTAGTVLNALFTQSESAMHVEYFKAKPDSGEFFRRILISNQQYQEITDYIQGSFELDNQKPQLIDGYSYYGTDQFYEAKGSYSMFNTCNSWTNGALKSAKTKTAQWAIFTRTVMAYRK